MPTPLPCLARRVRTIWWQASPTTLAGPEEQALARERRANVRTAVGGLRPEQQRVLALRFVGDLSAAEIGRTLGKSAEAVRVSLHRALRDLRGRVPRDI